MGMKRRPAVAALAFLASGSLLVCAGVALVFPPAALILAGVAFVAVGLFGFEVTP